MILDTTLYLGPAEVTTPAGKPGFLEVQLPDGETCWARLALAIPYSPARSDEVLLIRQEHDSAYVIGVLRGSGTTTLRVPGDLNLDAPNGAVRLRAGTTLQLKATDAVEITSRRATVKVARFSLVATTLVQRVTSAYTWATGLVQSKSRRLRQVAEEGWLVRAGRAHLKTTDNVHINGKTIHLG